jgi:hypothetical protein
LFTRALITHAAVAAVTAAGLTSDAKREGMAR